MLPFSHSSCVTLYISFTIWWLCHWPPPLPLSRRWRHDKIMAQMKAIVVAEIYIDACARAPHAIPFCLYLWSRSPSDSARNNSTIQNNWPNECIRRYGACETTSTSRNWKRQKRKQKVNASAADETGNGMKWNSERKSWNVRRRCVRCTFS